ncbi:acyltransferase family protein [uncultured Alcanivorax sp.]|jgi:peptidoglycan/LPS O-acetylase OafA/YrhL|uniref:acyltransferase family protein n=1 Tax=uncultured Alcanivorax sp. TaxID=191215 RepID=UPI0025F83B77|nr:acyltransferase family protein [uncultured Alcanivorax sp.]
MSKGYQPHLDGLRAIAVGLVVFYHAGFSGIGAGYIGVDVFFVLSGFLITGQLIKNLDEGSFSFTQFYTRRIRRLVPAFVVVAISTLLAGAFILLPDDLIYLSRLAALAMLSVGNFYLANTTGSYFETDTEEIALLHTWSLAVEEQFYLLWPLLLLVLWRYIKPALRLKAIGVLLFGAVLFSGWYSQADPSRAYYLLPARFHELLLGALLAMFAAEGKLPALTRPIRELLCWIGLFLIIQPAISWDAQRSFPGYSAIIPCFGTALLIYAGRGTSTLNWILTRRTMIWLGMVSYSLYLWHWPVFSFTHYAIGDLPASFAVIGILLALLCADLTWRFVEQPVRFHWRATTCNTFASLFFGPTLILVVIAGTIYAGEGFVGRFGDGTQAKIQAMESKPTLFPHSCPDSLDKPCADILLAGDSHAEHYGDFISVLADDAGLSFNVMTRAGCPVYPGLRPANGSDDDIEIDGHCPAWNQTVLAQSHRYRFVILGGYWALTDIKGDRYFFVSDKRPVRSQENSAINIRQSMKQAIRGIIESGATPILIQDNATVDDQDFKCSRMNLLPFHDQECVFPRHVMDEQQANKRALFAELAKTFPTLEFIDPTTILCDKKHCRTEIEGVPLYRDDDHLNRIGSSSLGERYLQENGNPFLLAPTLAINEEKSGEK